MFEHVGSTQRTKNLFRLGPVQEAVEQEPLAFCKAKPRPLCSEPLPLLCPPGLASPITPSSLWILDSSLSIDFLSAVSEDVGDSSIIVITAEYFFLKICLS